MHSIAIFHVELIAVSVPLGYLGIVVEFFRERAFNDFGWPCAQAHTCPFLSDATLFLQQRDDWLYGGLIELSAVCVFDSTDVSCEFNRRYLHTETKTEKWNVVLARVTRGIDFSFSSANTKPARNQDAGHIFQLGVDAVLQ